MPILALECSGAACSVAIRRNGRTEARLREAMARGHAAAVAPMVRRALAAAGLAPADIGAVAVGAGPGSFTGLRIAIAAAKGLALALDRPLAGVSGFEAAARRAAGDGAPEGAEAGDLLAIALESRRAEVFAELRAPDGGIALPGRAVAPRAFWEEVAAAVAPGARIRLEGCAAGRLAEAAPGPRRAGLRPVLGRTGAPDAADIALVAEERLAAEAGAGAGYRGGVVPIYLSPPYAAAPK